MKKLLKALTIFLMGGTSLLAADSCCDTHTCCELDGCWEAGLELLYWRACVCDFDYAVVEYNNFGIGAITNVNVQRVRPSNHPGFRIFGTYYTKECCRFLTLDWLHLRATDTSRTELPVDPAATVQVKFPTQTAAASVTVALGQLRGIYNKINLRIGQNIYCCHDLDVYTYAGARLLDINTYRRVEVNHLASVWRQRAEYSAFGVELGVGGNYCFDCGLGVAAWFGATAAVGQQKYRSEVETAPGGSATVPEGTTKFPSHTRCIPGLEGRLGINYTKCCECWTAIFELGYEHHHYFGADVMTNPQSLFFANHSKSQCSDLGFGGPYLSLTVSY